MKITAYGMRVISLLILNLELIIGDLKLLTSTVYYIYIYIYPRFLIEQTWKIAKLRMRTEMEEQFYTTLFHFIIT